MKVTPVSELACRRLESGHIPGTHRHSSPLVEKRGHNRLTDSATSTGDEDAFVGQFEIHHRTVPPSRTCTIIVRGAMTSPEFTKLELGLAAL